MYAEHFGFSELPFTVTPDPQAFFDNFLYQEAFATLRYGVLAKKGFVVITGEVGTGKTTLLRKLLHSLEPSVHSVLIFDTQVGFVELLRLILDDLNLAHNNDDKLAMIETLNQYLIERLGQGHIVTLLIDEAQNLSDEALEGLRLLSRIEIDSEKLLQIVLMGQPELEIKLNQPKLRQLKQRITLQCRLAPLKKEEVGAYIEFRLNAVGFRGKGLFERSSLEAIAVYSKGIPRLINIICDNALRIACAASKRTVSAQMVEEVAHDLQLGPLRPIEAARRVYHKMPPNPVKPRVEEKRLPEFENLLVGAAKQHRPQPKRSLTGLGLGVALGVVILGAIAVSYSQPSKIHLSDLAARSGDFTREGMDYFSDWTVKVNDFFERTEESIAHSTANAGDLSRWSKDYLAGWATRMGDSVRSHWKSLNRVKPITITSEDNSSKIRWTDSNDVNPGKRTEPLFGDPAPAAEKPSLISQESREPKQDKNVPLPVVKEPAETQIAKNTGPPIAGSEPTPLESPNDEQTPYLGNFEVVGKSFVRDTPGSDADIITTLQPGTWVRVESKTGKYLRVRSLNNSGVQGYVHEEDAFFKRAQ